MDHARSAPRGAEDAILQLIDRLLSCCVIVERFENYLDVAVVKMRASRFLASDEAEVDNSSIRMEYLIQFSTSLKFQHTGPLSSQGQLVAFLDTVLSLNFQCPGCLSLSLSRLPVSPLQHGNPF